MSLNRALLFGVSEYPNAEEFSPLTVVIKDVAALAKALKETRYEVTSESGDHPLKLTRNGLKGTLAHAVRQAQDGEVLLLYFSGHGLNHDGRDYLVPTDVSLENPNRLKEFLVPVDLEGAVQQSRARLVLFCVDACREDVNWDWKSIRKGIGGGNSANQDGPIHFVTLFSCAPEEYSRFDDELSHFTRALIDALSPSTPAATLGEVIKHAQKRLDEITTAANSPKQTIHWRVEQRADGSDPLELTICTGDRSRLNGAASSPWDRAVGRTPLWNLAPEGVATKGRHEALQDVVRKIVSYCWLTWEEGRTALPEDPWRDEDYAPRVIKRLEQLLFKQDDPVIPLNYLEIAALIVAPFVREAVWASIGTKAASSAAPLDPAPSDSNDSLRVALKRRYDMEPQWRRKLERLKTLDRDSDLAAVACWQLYRVIQREAEVWQSEAEGGWLTDDMTAAWLIEEDAHQEIAEGFTASRLLELARTVAASGEWLDQLHRHGELSNEVTVGDGASMVTLHERLLGWLLAFAGHLAIDVRRLPNVIVDHVGLGDPIQPCAVVAQLRRSRWLPKREGFTLSLSDCDHPALDHALACLSLGSWGNTSRYGNFGDYLYLALVMHSCYEACLKRILLTLITLWVGLDGRGKRR